MARGPPWPGLIAAVTVKGRRGDTVVADDEYIRHDSSIETMARLRPAFTKDGTVTAGNASQQNDASAACLVVAEDKLEELGLEPIGYFTGWAAAGCEPTPR